MMQTHEPHIVLFFKPTDQAAGTLLKRVIYKIDSYHEHSPLNQQCIDAGIV